MAELVDARDLKSLDGNVVWVRVPPPAPVMTNRPNGAISLPGLMQLIGLGCWVASFVIAI